MGRFCSCFYYRRSRVVRSQNWANLVEAVPVLVSLVNCHTRNQSSFHKTLVQETDCGLTAVPEAICRSIHAKQSRDCFYSPSTRTDRCPEQMSSQKNVTKTSYQKRYQCRGRCIVFRNKIIAKSSINESDETKPPKGNYSYLKEGGRGIKSDTRNHSQIDGSRENETLENR